MTSRSPLVRRLVAGALGTALIATGSAAFIVAPASAAELPESLIGAETTWSYSDDNTDPAAGDANRLVWTEASYDDSAWKSAKGAFGAKKGQATGIGAAFPITTLLNQYISGTETDVPTFHFRTSFDLTADQLSAFDALQAEVVYDDAIQVFVNGEKVAGFHDARVADVPEAQQNLTYAGDSNGDPVTSQFTIDADALVAGENTISVALYQDRESSSDIYFDFTSLTPKVATTATHDNVVLTIGSDQSSRNVTWYTDTDSAQSVQFAKADGGEAVTVPASGAQTTSGEFNRRAELTGLEENTTYTYRVGSDEDGWSAEKSFRTASFSGDYDFLFFGDPQIGASGNVQSDGEGWQDTLDVALDTYPSSEILFSAGDQVNSAASEAEYDAYLAPEAMSSIATVPVNGNHDVGSKAYEQHYTVPNLDETAGAATSANASGGDYWFTYKDVLYVVLNSNSGDIDSHIAFMDKVVAEHGDEAKWKVLAFHHSIYSIAAHVNDQQIKDLRAGLPEAISDLGFDLVLQGHDHSYTRTYLIKDGQIADATEVPGQSQVSAGEGEVLYVTANSASGSKYYDITEPNAFYASVINQEKVRNYSHISITDDSITVTTLRSEAKGDDKPVNSVVDEVTLVRDDVTAPEIALPAESANTIVEGADFDPLAGVSATDDRDGDLTSALTVTGTVDAAKAGSYELTYSVQDAAGNAASATRTVTVVAESVDPTDPVTPTDPTDPVTPTDPTDPVTPTDPTDPVTPTDPTDPVTPTDPTDPVTPTDPTDPVTPTDPTDPVTPTDPTDPVTPTDPTDPTTPTDPAVPATAAIALEGDAAVQGGTVVFTGTGFLPGEQIAAEVHSDPVSLGTVTATQDGAVRISWTIPADFASGAHELVLTRADGSTITTAFTVQEAAAAASTADEAVTPVTGDVLATTGADVPVGMVVLAALLLLAGGGFVFLRRRKA